MDRLPIRNEVPRFGTARFNAREFAASPWHPKVPETAYRGCYPHDTTWHGLAPFFAAVACTQANALFAKLKLPPYPSKPKAAKLAGSGAGLLLPPTTE